MSSTRWVRCLPKGRTALWLLMIVSIASPMLAVEPAPVVAPVRKRTVAPVVLPKVNDAGHPVREVVGKNYRIELDLHSQVLEIHLPKPEGWRTAGEFRAGDTVEITGNVSQLKSGQTVIASLGNGQLLSLSGVQGDWLGTAIAVDGQRKQGWVHKRDVKFRGEELPIRPTLAHVNPYSNDGFISAAMLVQKAKQFDDGLYAAVDLAAQQGAGKFGGKTKLLAALTAKLGGDPQTSTDEAALTLFAAAKLGDPNLNVPLDRRRGVDQLTATFLRDPLRSKPIGFYTWSKELSSVFQQDRMLQGELKGAAGNEQLIRALHQDAASRETYTGYLQLIERLTNPLTKPDLRPSLAALDRGEFTPPADKVHFFPPSRSHETDLVMRLFENQPIPAGFSLIDELIKRIRSGDIDLTPRADSGWYDHQTWSQEPLVIPEKMPEAARLRMNDEYRKQLVELFKGALALARETHIKQLEIPSPASEAGGRPEPRPKVFVAPELTLEPLATMYQRRAMSYRFVRGVLEATFGVETLASLHRQTAAGPVAMPLSEELAQMEAVFHGAFSTANMQLGTLPKIEGNVGSKDGPLADAAAFLKWREQAEGDPDIGQDVRMMVPVFYDQMRKQTKVWVFLGWVEREGYVSFAKHPGVGVYDDQNQRVAADSGPEVQFHGASRTFIYPVTAEIYVNQILNREEFRRHCDIYQTQSVILANLK